MTAEHWQPRARVYTRDGIPLRVRQWAPTGAGSPFVVFVLHGVCDHAERHGGLARWFGPRGGAVVGFDMRGQGRSGGTPGHVQAVSVHGDDLEDVISHVREELPDELQPVTVPWFLFGHGFGGLVALTYLLDRGGDHPFAGLILSSPLLGLGDAVRPGVVPSRAIEAAAGVAPRMPLPVRGLRGALSRDPAVVSEHRRDPAVVSRCTAQWVVAAREAMARVEQEIAQVTVPALWCVGTADRVSDPAAIERVFARRATRSDHTLRRFEGYAHELHNEPELFRLPVRTEILRWLSARARRVRHHG